MNNNYDPDEIDLNIDEVRVKNIFLSELNTRTDSLSVRLKKYYEKNFNIDFNKL